MAEYLSPFVYWGQDKGRIMLKVDLKEVENPEVHVTEDNVKFKAHGLGVAGSRDYSFEVDFYLPIDAKGSKYRITGRHIEFQLPKIGVGECWPRLTHSSQKLAWLKVDFDHFFMDDENDSSGSETMKEQVLRKTTESRLRRPDEEVPVTFRLVYMVLFNLFQTVGFTYIIVVLLFKLLQHGKASKTEAFASVGPQMACVLSMAVMEVVHPIFGWVRSSVVTTAMQVFGRGLIFFVLIMQESRLQHYEATWWLFIVWSLVEVVRYPYYLLSCVKKEWGFLTWLRYTIWIPLYPAGFVLEGTVMLLALQFFEETHKFSMTLPNAWNFSFNFATFLKIYMFACLPGMYLLMQHMYQLRKKKLPFRRPPSRKTKLS
ncbi:Very-long-chain (3R)-3-hydroxyacyl-CoA dehydratase [Lamellibrachia satsuma]|nr:Very-long-chain (3R)-3-hydroxyacyl-CoA dehydratase [Lamellibrachia satsuma]